MYLTHQEYMVSPSEPYNPKGCSSITRTEVVIPWVERILLMHL